MSKKLCFVDSNTALDTCIVALRNSSTIAFDLEFDSHNYSYGITLCLLQVASDTTCYVIDPFASIDLSALYKVFEDKDIEKVMHSPGEDLRLLHSLQVYPKHLFDTEVTAKLLNFEQTSLSSLLNHYFGNSLNKKQQRSNWLKRPLTEEQIQYAGDDVAWLQDLKHALVADATERGLMPFVMEEQDALSETIYKAEVKDTFLRQSDLKSLSPYDQYVLNGLFLYRDELARKINKPAFQVLDEALLRSLAAGEVQPQAIPDTKGVYRGFKNKSFADSLATRLSDIHKEAASKGLSGSIPRKKRPGPGEYENRRVAENDKVEKFAPIQQVLTERYGRNTSRFILSNSTVNNLLSHTASISSIKRNYKQQLIRSIAGELGIDLSSYE